MGEVNAGSASTWGRRQFLTRMALVAAAGPGLLSACAREGTESGPLTATETGNGASPGTSRPLTIAFHEAHLSRYDVLDDINDDIGQRLNLTSGQAPVEGFGASFFIAEAAREESTWDVYTSLTPFVEMQQLVSAGAIIPWNDYLSPDAMDDILPQVRAEGSVGSDLYNFPWVLDIVMTAGNTRIIEQAGIDPTELPKTWDEFIEKSRQVKDSGAAPFGCTFDASGWRSIAPIAYSISPEIYAEDGLIDFTHEAVVEAAEILKRIFELSNPNNLDSGASHGGFGGTPDRGVWAAEDCGYYVQFTNAPISLANNWSDPDALKVGGLPSVPGGAGSTVFWSTGLALLAYGENHDEAGEYADLLTSDQRMWQAAAGEEDPVGQIPGRESIWEEWRSSSPQWLADWVAAAGDSLEQAQPIRNHLYSFDQFTLARPHWESYLTGDESNVQTAMEKANKTVRDEIESSSNG